MRGRLLWFWPLLIAIPVAVGVVIRSNKGPAQPPGDWPWLTVGLFSYTLYYFVLTWPVWLIHISQTRRTVISSLVPVALLLILSVVFLPRRAPFLDVTVFMPSSSLWFVPGATLLDKLKGFTPISPCEISMWEVDQHGLSTEIVDVAYQPDGKILIQGFNSKEGTLKNGYKLSRLLQDGSIDSTFKGQDRCMNLSSAARGHIQLQPDGKILLASSSISSSPTREDALALIVSSEGEEFRRVSIPRLPTEQYIEGQPVEVQLQPDGGLLMYGVFSRKERSKSGSPILRITPEGLPDPSSWREMSGLVVDSSALGARGADGRRFIVGYNPKYEETLFPAVYSISAEGQPDAAFHERLLEVQREKGLRQASALAVQAGGKLVVAFAGAGEDSDVVRLNPDGTLDDTFERKHLRFAANHVSVLADGAIIVAEVGLLGAYEGRAPLALVRLHANGSVDAAVTGRFSEAFAEQGIESILGLTVRPDGTVLLYRSAPRPFSGKTLHQLVQLRPDGSVDTGFHPPL